MTNSRKHLVNLFKSRSYTCIDTQREHENGPPVSQTWEYTSRGQTERITISAFTPDVSAVVRGIFNPSSNDQLDESLRMSSTNGRYPLSNQSGTVIYDIVPAKTGPAAEAA